MFGLFKSKPDRKLNERYQTKLQEAMEAQRAGDIRKYSELSEEAEAIMREIEALERNVPPK